MHNPLPAVITGLHRDMEYNYNLSNLDKAYMCIIYPWPGGKAHDIAPDWTSEYALAKTGIVSESPEYAAKIGEVYADGDKGTFVDPTGVRELFAEWCHESLRMTNATGR